MVTVLTTEDKRGDPIYPVGQRVIPITIAAEGTVGSTSQEVCGRIVKMIYDVPALVGTTTVTIAVLDADGTSHYSKASVAEGAKTLDVGMVAAATPHGIVVAGNITFQATATNAQTGAAATISVIVYVI
jgi:hypothetical protein